MTINSFILWGLFGVPLNIGIGTLMNLLQNSDCTLFFFAAEAEI